MKHLAAVLQGRPVELLETAEKPKPSAPYVDARGIFSCELMRLSSYVRASTLSAPTNPQASAPIPSANVELIRMFMDWSTKCA